MTSTILITGGTGTLGGRVLPRLRAAADLDVRVLSRKPQQAGDGVAYVTGDLLTGEGVEAAVAGADTVLHLAGGPKGDAEAARTLVRAAAGAGVRHLVYISVIGADVVPIGYFKAKLGGERAVEDSGVPWTTLRAAQFHDLVLTTAQKVAKLPVLPVPGAMRLQPVETDEVAARLVELALGEPAGLVPDLAGPRIETLRDLLSAYLAASGKRRPFLPVRLPGAAGRVYRTGENLARPGAETGKRTWEEFLAERLA